MTKEEYDLEMKNIKAEACWLITHALIVDRQTDKDAFIRLSRRAWSLIAREKRVTSEYEKSNNIHYYDY